MLVKNYLAKEDIAFLNEINLDNDPVEDMSLNDCLKAIEKRLDQMKEKLNSLISIRNEGGLINLADLETFAKNVEKLIAIHINLVDIIANVNKHVDDILKQLFSLFS